MKKIIILLIFINLLNLFAQKEPAPAQFRFGNENETGLSSFSSQRFPQDKFIIGWWWGHDMRITDNMNSNMATNGDWFLNESNYTYRPQTTSTLNSIICPYSIGLPWYTESFQYEPTLLKEDGNEGTVVPREDESVPSIFGFKTKHPNILLIEDFNLTKVDDPDVTTGDDDETGPDIVWVTINISQFFI